MKLEDRIELYLREGELNENGVASMVSKVKDFTSKKAKSAFKKYWNELKRIVQQQGVEKEFLRIVNKHLGTNVRSLKQLDKSNESEMNEDFKHYGKGIKDNAFPTLLIFPGLQIFFELDKLIDGSLSDLNVKKIIVYAVFWLIVATGSHITQWKKGKEENPKEGEKEGEPGPFSIKSVGRG